MRVDTIPPERRTFSKKGADVRRQELIDATFRCLVNLGVWDTSVRTIAAEAGLSLGMVRHHFNSKDELLAATYLNMSQRLQQQTQEILARTPADPVSQLTAFINAGLQPPLLDHNYVRIRFLFFELTHTNKVVRDVHDQIYARFEMELLDLVRTVANANNSDVDCLLLTRTITTYLKGIWAEWTLSSDEFEPRELLAELMPFWMQKLAVPVDAAAGASARERVPSGARTVARETPKHMAKSTLRSAGKDAASNSAKGAMKSTVKRSLTPS